MMIQILQLLIDHPKVFVTICIFIYNCYITSRTSYNYINEKKEAEAVEHIACYRSDAAPEIHLGGHRSAAPVQRLIQAAESTSKASKQQLQPTSVKRIKLLTRRQKLFKHGIVMEAVLHRKG